MQYIAIAETDIGIAKKTNQDSVLIKHADSSVGQVLMAVICDGMGGLDHGELASAEVIRAFDQWFDEELPYELKDADMEVIGGKWALLLKSLNLKIAEYSNTLRTTMGTTFTGVLFINDDYVVVHVGDTRFYEIDAEVRQMTTDQTFVARELSRGNLTKEQLKKDKRRNMLLQCIGASEKVEPEIITGKAQPCTYMICSDGFRHENTNKEIYESFQPINLLNKEMMKNNARFLIEQAKKRQERDNISVLLIKAY